MQEWIPILAAIGTIAPLALGAIGSIIGCARAGQAAIGALLETESGHGKYIGLSAMPSSQTIYGIVVSLSFDRLDASAGPAVFGAGVLTGLALLASAAYQGNCCASAVNAAKNKPEIFGISIAPAAIVEGFAVFVFVFALVLTGPAAG
ncbi:MAG: ATP synthase subunit C [Myxococcales bacterium]|jgi:V/A-type H+-transporting ATPase subunit K